MINDESSPVLRKLCVEASRILVVGIETAFLVRSSKLLNRNTLVVDRVDFLLVLGIRCLVRLVLHGFRVTATSVLVLCGTLMLFCRQRLSI